MVRKAGVTMMLVGWFCMVGTAGAIENSTDASLFHLITQGLFWAIALSVGFLVKDFGRRKNGRNT